MNKKEANAGNSFLPNAPLVEVVFELRWKLQGDAQTPPPFFVDPGYQILVGNFIADARQYKFTAVKEIEQSKPPLAYSIQTRLYKIEGEPFPLWQVGPGIFACNESSSYTWRQFKKLAIDGVKTLLSSYPKIKGFDFKPTHLELRYLDSFDSTFVNDQDPLRFLNENTSLKIDLPSFLKKKPLGKDTIGTLQLKFPISNMRDTGLYIKIGNGKVEDRESVVLQSSVITESDSINFGKTLPRRLKFLGEWLESAHNLTSPFFKEFVSSSLMDKFERPPNATA